MSEALVGKTMPYVMLKSTAGHDINPARLQGLAVLCCYPWTGRPGIPNPPGWDDIPGAHGSTPQLISASAEMKKFQANDAQVFGLSVQDTEWQAEFAKRAGLSFPLLSDSDKSFATALGLPIFQTGDGDYLQRLTLIARDAKILAVLPEIKPSEILGMLETVSDDTDRPRQ